VAVDFKLENYGAERLRNLIHKAKQVMPAEFQAHVNHFVRDPSSLPNDVHPLACYVDV